jgi:hypothetical protein
MRADQPVARGEARRTWLWGPQANSYQTQEQYQEHPDGLRTVLYFEKARMEITDPGADPADLWYVTNGLLVVEMIAGRVQLGDNAFADADPANIPVAGDPDDVTGPTYAALASVLSAPPAANGAPIIQRIDHTGQVTADPTLAARGVTAAYRLIAGHIDHQVASVFWEFMNSEALIWEDGAYVTGRLFENPFYATGYPVTEPYWARVKVNGVVQEVLVQCFERRCLTYTPGNDPGWQIEAGNVGQHYYRWRYGKDWPGPAHVLIYLVALGDNGASGERIGCDDSLIPVTVEIRHADTVEERIARALESLLALDEPYYGESGLYTALYQSNLAVESVSIDGGTATVNLTGELLIGGVCDEPRVIAQLETTVERFQTVTDVVVLLNGGPLFPTS